MVIECNRFRRPASSVQVKAEKECFRMKRLATIFALLVTLTTTCTVFATEYLFVGFDPHEQNMYCVIKGDGPFHATVYVEQTNPDGFLSGQYFWYNEATQGLEAGAHADDVDLFMCQTEVNPGDIATGDYNALRIWAQFYDENYNPTYVLETWDTLDVVAGEFTERDTEYGYQQGDCVPVLPDTIHINTSFCATICHGTYSIPIYCEDPDYTPPLVEVTVTNGCDPNDTHCDNPECPRIDTTLFTYRIRVFPGCRIFLVMTYCGEGPGCVCIWRSDFVLPAEMLSFTASPSDRAVTLNWATASETNTEQFVVTRSLERDGVYSEVHRGEAAGSSATRRDYSWTDRSVINGRTYYYKLHYTDANGNHVYSDNGAPVVVEATPGANIPTAFSLQQNFPNPFNAQTSFAFDLPTNEMVSLTVFDLLGREVATVLNGHMEAGHHTLNWSAEGLASGIYTYTLTAGSYTDSKKLLFLK